MVQPNGIEMISSVSLHEARKSDHIRIALDEDVGFGRLTTGLDRFRFEHQALPECDLAEVDTRTRFLGAALSAPILISCMTGGAERGAQINRRLAIAAQHARIALGLGSGRAALDDPQLAETFLVRDLAPDIPILANIGASQIIEPDGLERCERLIHLVGADGLVVHANPLQEALQPEGTPTFRGVIDAVRTLARDLSVPVIVKEVGWGISPDVARRLAAAGVAGVDVAGAGGTSWSEVERHRMSDPVMRDVARSFRDWGIATADCLPGCRDALGDRLVIASGGLRSGIDMAKCIALGADAVGVAAPFLRAAVRGAVEVVETIRRFTTELRICMFCIGARDLNELRHTPHLSRTRSDT
jgi:isopentenyl-diphosphate Delta-isomerase